MKPQSLPLLTTLLCLAQVFASPADAPAEQPLDANRLSYLEQSDPFYPNVHFPKLTTPQWVGEPGVDAVVILAIDDMRQPEKYETVLRPLLERLKQIDGRAPVSILCNHLDVTHPKLQQWLKEGLSLEVHTLTHPCPFLAKSNFTAAADNYHQCVELINRIPGNKPVAFRMPCCDSINSPSPRFYAEIFNRTNAQGQFLTLDSSVMNIPTANDTSVPKELVVDPNGKERFRKYLPFPSFTTTIEDYPYPYVIGKLCWEFPAMVPSDWEAQHIQGTNSPITVADWKAALDATVLKQGTFTFIFHPHGWIRPDQMVEFIDYAAQRYGKRVKFLNFREAAERLNTYLLAGQPLRRTDGEDNGVRLLDLNNDGYLDVVIANEQVRKTRLWDPQTRSWHDTEFPTSLVTTDPHGARAEAGVRFGIVEPDGFASMLVNAASKGAWHFDGQKWIERKSLLFGFDLDGQAIQTAHDGADRGVRFLDLDQDGRCELIVGNPTQSAVFAWSPEEESWKKLVYALPPGTSIVDAQGRDNGLRFVDVNEDGYPDVVFSNPERYSFHLFIPKLHLGFQAGWSREVLSGRRGEPGEIPMIVRGGPAPNNGAWFHSHQLWVQNEDTATMPDNVDRRSYGELLGGLQPKAKTPQESLAAIQVRPGFKVELVAAEPLVKDPIAFEWGADGKLWVVEMGDYPLGIDGRGTPGGIVRFLEDTDGDGRYDKSTVFLEGVNFPTGVIPWGKGVIVSAAPEIFYAEDTNGDGKADVRIPLFTGFREGNQQHRLNGFDYGLDNWLYGANGDSGGQVRAVGITPSARPPRDFALSDATIDLRGHDFRFRPDIGVFETVSGQTQYGRHRDDWGNWFGNDNPVWLWHFFVPEHYLTRNPYLPVRSVKQYLANYPDSTRAYPISRTLQRYNDVAMVGHVTSANSPTPYRDEIFGPEFASSIFVSEPVHNLVHREVLEPDGVSFTSHRASDEQNREFLASADNWFRPTMSKTGPDGALYIADMYRLVIEHPEWIPADAQAHVDLRAGHDMGRIYRVSPEGAKLRATPRLAGLAPAQLVAFLESPNGWTRDTAQRLLVEAGDVSVAPKLREVAAHAPNPKSRIQALCTLDGIVRAPLVEAVLTALQDSHPIVREHAVRLSERYLSSAKANPEPGTAPQQIDEVKARLLSMTADPAIRVRYQLAFTLGEWKDQRAGEALVKLAERDPDQEHIRTAVLSSAVPHVKTMLQAAVQEQSQPPVQLLQDLLGLAVALKRDDALIQPLHALAARPSAGYAFWQLTALSGFLDGVERERGSLRAFEATSTGPLKESINQLAPVFAQAHQLALSSSTPEPERLAAIRLLGRGLNERDQDPAALSELLRPQAPSPVQKAALTNLARRKDASVATLLLAGWRNYEPSLRAEVLNALLSRVSWTEQLLSAIESGSVSAAQISTPNQQKLLNHSQAAVRERAQKLFVVAANRRQLLKQYEQVLESSGDATKGAAIFRQNCSTCHRLHDEGFSVGPDLGALGSKSPQTLLIAILDPNQAVEARYVSYTARTKSDREISGIIVAETPSSVTLRSAGGSEETILRSDLDELSSSGLSLMPEGFEKVMTPQDLTDLIAFLTSPN